MSWQQSGSSCHCMPPSCGTSDLGDATEDEEVQRDPRASSTLLLEEAQVGSGLSFSATLHQRNTLTLRASLNIVLWKNLCVKLHKVLVIPGQPTPFHLSYIGRSTQVFPQQLSRAFPGELSLLTGPGLRFRLWGPRLQPLLRLQSRLAFVSG